MKIISAEKDDSMDLRNTTRSEQVNITSNNSENLDNPTEEFRSRDSSAARNEFKPAKNIAYVKKKSFNF